MQTLFVDFSGAGTICKELYQPIADAWMVYDNSGDKPELIEKGP